jgi:hypothetical protein
MYTHVKENEFLKALAESANTTIEFKDEKILPGTAWISGMPIDITIHDNCLILNSVGEFGGTAKTFAKSKNKGKGIFKSLYQHISDLIKKYGLAERIYLTPLSPVWDLHYSLVEVNEALKGHYFYLDTSRPSEP